ncbi:hypothetical protein [Pseudomonas aeruginosa]|nr:hypothetical protein [Pseudomonas aeruginosa]HEJ3621341.1 hypothetical protein [Pseudomonas aeruginosa]
MNFIRPLFASVAFLASTATHDDLEPKVYRYDMPQLRVISNTSSNS